ncbi:MAG: hypothetical protein KIT31_12400 [Deltaproteobacteria bacterium]|nr:hypothetical protein [Deltaproteobacteria bacterium]
MRLAVLVAITLAPACPSGPTSRPEPVASPRACEKMADHLIEVMLDGIEQKPGGDAPSRGKQETADALTRMFIQICVDTKWSVEAQTCFGGVAKLEDTNGCAEYLTVPQRDAAGKAIEDMFGKRPPGGDAGAPEGDGVR